MKQICPRCEESGRLKDPFVESVWRILLDRGEIEDRLHKIPICGACFKELRDVLIELDD